MYFTRFFLNVEIQSKFLVGSKQNVYYYFSRTIVDFIRTDCVYGECSKSAFRTLFNILVRSTYDSLHTHLYIVEVTWCRWIVNTPFTWKIDKTVEVLSLCQSQIKHRVNCTYYKYPFFKNSICPTQKIFHNM